MTPEPPPETTAPGDAPPTIAPPAPAATPPISAATESPIPRVRAPQATPEPTLIPEARGRPVFETTARVIGFPQSIALPARDGVTGNLLLPSNDAANATMTLRALPSSFTPGGAAALVHDGKAYAVLELTVDRRLTMRAPPSFSFGVPKGAPIDRPTVVELYDDRNRLLTIIDQFRYAPAAYDGGSFPEDAAAPRLTFEAGRRYFAVLVVAGDAMFDLGSTLASRRFDFEPIAGIRTALFTPVTLSGGARYEWRLALEPPLGTPALAPPDARQALAYATLLVIGNVTFAGPASVRIDLPPEMIEAGARYGIAVFDKERWPLGWQYPTSLVATLPPNVSRLTFPLALPPTRVLFDRYVFALYRSIDNPPVAARAVPPPAAAPVVAVLGDSTALLTLLPPSRIGCTGSFMPAPACQATAEASASYPGIAASLAGLRLCNLAWLGTVAGSDAAADSQLAVQVPLIPSSARVVVFAGGLGDVVNHPGEDRRSVLRAIDAAMRRRAPRAHIVYVGIRYFNATSSDRARKTRIDEWDALESELARRRGGAFVDPRALLPPGPSAYVPDGTHGGVAGNRAIGAALALAIRTLAIRTGARAAR